ncbi:hypothetical protein BSKO_00468 [Bryopsis sp. KO-2023]|nr:hypothetical protein BSKO_00468 [Bryopsis sp. KO-2023]
MESVNTAGALAASIENEASFRMTEARFLACQTDCKRLEEKLRRAEDRAEQLETALHEKTQLNAKLEEEASGAKREIVDKEQALAIKERQLARLQEAQEHDRNSSSVALQALQRDEDRFTELLAENRDLGLQVASLTVGLSSEQDRLGALQTRNRVLEQQSEELSAALTSLREEFFGEKQELTAQLQEVQSDLHHAGFNIDSLKDGEAKWQERCRVLEGEKRDLMSKMIKESEVWAAKEVELKAEVDRMTRARDLFKDAAVQRDNKIEMLQASCARLDVMAQEQKKAHESVVRSAELLQSDTDAKLERYKAMVESVDMGFIPKRIPNAVALQGVSLEIAPIEDFTKPDLYMRYAELFEACKRGKDKLARKTEYIHYLTDEQRKASEYVEGLRKKFDDQSQICMKLRAEVEALEKAPKVQEKTIFALESELGHVKKMLRVTEQCAEDQSRQIKHLLEENTRMGVGLYPRKSLSSMKQGKAIDAGSAISQDLVTVDNINEMVQQNKELRTTLRLLAVDCEEKEASWLNGLESEKKKLAEFYDHNINDLNDRLQASMNAAQKLEKEKNAYFDMMMSGQKKPTDLALALGSPANASAQEAMDSAQTKIRKLEGDLRASQTIAAQVTVLEANLKSTKEELAKSYEQILLLQSTHVASHDVTRDVEIKYKSLKNVLHSTKKELLAERQLSRTAKNESIRLEHSNQVLEAQVSDLTAKIARIREENSSTIQAKEKAVADLHQETLERKSLEWKIQSVEAQHSAEISKLQREDMMESTIQGTLAKFGQQMSSVAAEVAKREALEAENAKLEGSIKDSETKMASLNSQISTLKSTLAKSEATVAELRNTIKQQDQSAGASSESAKNVFVLNQRLKAAQEEAARRKVTAAEMEELSKENERKLAEREASLKEKEEVLAQVRTENHAYKRKVVSLAKSMKGGTSDEKKQMEAEVAEAKAQAASALEAKEKAEQSVKDMNSEMENAKKVANETQTALTELQFQYKKTEERVAEIQAELAKSQAEVQKTCADKALVDSQLKKLQENQGSVGDLLRSENGNLTEKVQQLEKDLNEQGQIHQAASQSLKEKEEELAKLKQASDDNTARVPFDVQQELERLRLTETGHQQELATLRGELEASKMEARSLNEKNSGLHGKLSVAQKTVVEVPALRARMDQVYTQYSETLEKANELGADNGVLRRTLMLKDQIIDNLKQQLAQGKPAAQEEMPKETPASVSVEEMEPPKQVLHGSSSGHLLELRERAMQSMQGVDAPPAFVSRGLPGDTVQVDGLEPASITVPPTQAGSEGPDILLPEIDPPATQAFTLDPPGSSATHTLKRGREEDQDQLSNEEDDSTLDLIVQTQQKRIRVTPAEDVDDFSIQVEPVEEIRQESAAEHPPPPPQQQQQEEHESIDYDESSSEGILEIIEPGENDEEEEGNSPGADVTEVEEGECERDDTPTAGTSEKPKEDDGATRSGMLAEQALESQEEEVGGMKRRHAPIVFNPKKSHYKGRGRPMRRGRGRDS